MKASTLSIFVFLIVCQTAFSALDCPVLFHGIKGHSACVATSQDFVSGDVSAEDIKVILDEHNKVRAKVNPPACNMLKLYWNDDLAYVAQRWAKNCKFDHDGNFLRSIPGTFSAGQNLGKGYSTWAGVIGGWANEVKDFTYGAENQLHKVGHYTQVVTDTTAMIGCGYAQCKGFKLHVCNYGPSGNSGSDGIKKPYEKCDKGGPLIDCNGKFCKNSGAMKSGTCECECKKWKHIYGDDCSTNCSVKDSNPCGSFFSEDKCSVYSNVPPQCPWTCHTCPYLDQPKAASTVAPITTIKSKEAGGDSEHKTSPKQKYQSTTPSSDFGDRPTFYPGFSGAVAFKYSVMSLLPLMVLFIANWLLQ